MASGQALGWIVVLNGAPRSGKTSIARAMQATSDELWVNLGVDSYMRTAPAGLHPSIGLRPGGERPDLEKVLPLLYRALYLSAAAHCRLGINVVMDVGHHDEFTRPLHILRDSMRALEGLPVLVVGVRCPLEVILVRREASRGRAGEAYDVLEEDGTVPSSILAWQRSVHAPGIYDMDVDTSALAPSDLAKKILDRLRQGQPAPVAARILGGA